FRRTNRNREEPFTGFTLEGYSLRVLPPQKGSDPVRVTGSGEGLIVCALSANHSDRLPRPHLRCPQLTLRPTQTSPAPCAAACATIWSWTSPADGSSARVGPAVWQSRGCWNWAITGPQRR